MIETIVIKIGKAILSKPIWIGIGIGVLLTLLLFATLCQPEPVIVTIGNGKPFTQILRDMSKPKFPYFIFIKGKDGKTDTFIATPDTPISEFPITCDSTIFPITIRINNKFIDPHEGIAKWWLQGIMDSIQFNIPVKQIKIKSDEKSIRLCGSVGLGYLNSGSIYAPAKIGLLFKKRISISGVTGYCNGWYVGVLLEAHF